MALQQIVESLKAGLGPCLLSEVLFGSTVRGTRREDSDVDLLLIYDAALSTRSQFRDRFVSIRRAIRSGRGDSISSETRAMLPLISPLIMSRSEAEGVPYVLLDIVDEGIILFDRDGCFLDIRQRVMDRLRELRAKRVRLKDGSWYWNLKPGAKFGEVITI